MGLDTTYNRFISLDSWLCLRFHTGLGEGGTPRTTSNRVKCRTHRILPLAAVSALLEEWCINSAYNFIAFNIQPINAWVLALILSEKGCRSRYRQLVSTEERRRILSAYVCDSLLKIQKRDPYHSVDSLIKR